MLRRVEQGLPKAHAPASGTRLKCIRCVIGSSGFGFQHGAHSDLQLIPHLVPQLRTLAAATPCCSHAKHTWLGMHVSVRHS